MKVTTSNKTAVSTTVLIALLFGVAGGTAAAEGKRYVQRKQGQRPTPTVAADNVCAWPNLTVLRDGTIVATIFNQPSHGSVAGDVECWASRDNGKTWQEVGTPAPHEPDTNRMNVAAGRAGDGDLIVIAPGWSNKYPSGKSGPAFRAGILRPWLSRSSDGGKTWSIDKTGLPERAPDGRRWVPFGDIVAAENGFLRAAVYSVNDQRPHDESAWCMESRRHGRTWGKFVLIDPTTSGMRRPCYTSAAEGGWPRHGVLLFSATFGPTTAGTGGRWADSLAGASIRDTFCD